MLGPSPTRPTLTMSLVREYRNIQSKVMLSFSRMSCWAVRVRHVPWGLQGGFGERLTQTRTAGQNPWIYSSVSAPPQPCPQHFTD